MSYKYFYRIKYEREIGNNEWAVGSITEQFRNSPLTSREFKHIRRNIYNVMEAFNATEVRACIYRISDNDYPGIGEFDGTENEENHDYDRLCGCFVPLVGIVHITKYKYATHFGWYNCGTDSHSKFYGRMIYK